LISLPWEPDYRRHGPKRSSKPAFEAVRLVVRAGTMIPTHKVPGQITILCLEGRAEIGLDGSSLQLTTHEWAYLEGGEPHSVRGIEDCSLLLTILLAT
jgi:quercetin dioxygenase-like cupin family protein